MKWKLQNQNEGPSGGNTKAERLFRAASAKQAVFTPGETRGFPTPPNVTFTAAMGVGEAGVGGGGSGPTLPVAPGSGSPFPRCSSEGLKDRKRLFPLSGDLHVQRGAKEPELARPLFGPPSVSVWSAGPSSWPTAQLPLTTTCLVGSQAAMTLYKKKLVTVL